jgi:hypothetical protein
MTFIFGQQTDLLMQNKRVPRVAYNRIRLFDECSKQSTHKKEVFTNSEAL